MLHSCHWNSCVCPWSFMPWLLQFSSFWLLSVSFKNLQKFKATLNPACLVLRVPQTDHYKYNTDMLLCATTASAWHLLAIWLNSLKFTNSLYKQSASYSLLMLPLFFFFFGLPPVHTHLLGQRHLSFLLCWATSLEQYPLKSHLAKLPLIACVCVPMH